MSNEQELELTLNEFQRRAAETAIYPREGHCLMYPLLGLVDEVGELIEDCVLEPEMYLSEWRPDYVVGRVLWCLGSLSKLAGHLKKLYRDQSGRFTDPTATELRSLAIEAQANVALLLQDIDRLAVSCAAKIPKVINGNIPLRIVKRANDSRVAELSDVLWYVAAMATELGCSLDTVGNINLEKLRSRQDRGKLQGSGDDR